MSSNFNITPSPSPSSGGVDPSRDSPDDIASSRADSTKGAGQHHHRKSFDAQSSNQQDQVRDPKVVQQEKKANQQVINNLSGNDPSGKSQKTAQDLKDLEKALKEFSLEVGKKGEGKKGKDDSDQDGSQEQKADSSQSEVVAISAQEVKITSADGKTEVVSVKPVDAQQAIDAIQKACSDFFYAKVDGKAEVNLTLKAGDVPQELAGAKITLVQNQDRTVTVEITGVKPEDLNKVTAMLTTSVNRLQEGLQTGPNLQLQVLKVENATIPLPASQATQTNNIFTQSSDRGGQDERGDQGGQGDGKGDGDQGGGRDGQEGQGSRGQQQRGRGDRS